MIFHKVEPRCAAWHYLRIGRPTASEFSRILTAGGKRSDQQEDYAHRILAEMMLGRPLQNDIQTGYMVRGQEEESGAIESFEFQSGLVTSLGGFWTTDEGDYGCSPDRMVGDDALLEIKVPAANTHTRYMLNSEVMAKEKHCQIQGELLVTGREKAYLVSWHPELPTVIKVVQRDEKYIDLLRAELGRFCQRLLLLRADLEQKWDSPFKPIVIPSEQAPSAPDPGPMGLSTEDLDWWLAQHSSEVAK